MNNTGFVAGTLIHTDKGLVPIQDIKVGDMVLSKSGWGTDESYKSVINTFCSQEQREVYALRYIDNYIEPDIEDYFEPVMNLPDMKPSKINIEILVENTPVWVDGEEDFEISEGWRLAREMTGHEKVIFKGGQEAGGIISINYLLKTPVDNVFYLDSRGDYIPIIIDIRNKKIKIYYIAHIVLEAYKNIFEADEHPPLADNIIIGDLNKHDILNEVIDLVRAPDRSYSALFTAEVFNIEVTDTHTYFVGEKGVLVHDLTQVNL
ncbi:hypothetical protein [Psychrobacter sp.]|uniref:hypothetical protein n=1 Tax=Psychrobacter sp. TaxID=56811 RepID=UPI003C712FD6